MTDLANFIQFDNDRLTGNIATLSFDVDLTGEALNSENPKAPVFRRLGRTPRNRPIEVGAIWKKQKRRDEDCYTLTVNTGHGKIHANLGRFPGQDDDTLMAVIPWH